MNFSTKNEKENSFDVNKMPHLGWWDGSELGTISKSEIIYKCKIPDTFEEYWQIETKEGFKLEAQAKHVKDRFLAIVDELKPIFGCSKRGTRIIFVGKQMYVLNPVRIKLISIEIKEPVPKRVVLGVNSEKTLDMEIVKDSILATALRSTVFVEQVRQIYAFRYLLAITSSGDRHIRLEERKITCGPNGVMPIPMGCSEVSTSIGVEGKGLLSGVISKRWFDEKNTLENTVKRMLRVDTTPEEELVERISKVRGRVEDVIDRIDKKWIWIGAAIVDRISDCLD